MIKFYSEWNKDIYIYLMGVCFQLLLMSLFLWTQSKILLKRNSLDLILNNENKEFMCL